MSQNMQADENAQRMHAWYEQAGLLQAEQDRLEQELSSGSSEGVLILHANEELISLPDSPSALKLQEAKLEAEIKKLMHSVRHSSTPDAADQNQPSGSSKHQQDTSAQPSAVTEYQNFTRLHGPHGGWSSEEAAEFEKVLRACRGEYDLAVQICDERMIGSSHEAVVTHARWRARERELFAKQKAAIAAWRMERRAAAMHSAAAAAAAVEDAHVDPALTQKLHEKQTRCRLQQMRKEAATRQAVAEWRRLKDAEKAQQQLLEHRAKQAQREQAAQLGLDQTSREARCAERAKQMKARKAEAADQAASQVVEQAQADPEAVLQIQMRNLALAKRKATLLASKETARKAQQERIVQLHHQALQKLPFELTPDPGRARQPTAATRQRESEIGNEERMARDSGFIRHLKPRAAAAWRRGLS